MASKIDSNVQGKAGTETITNFATLGDTSTVVSANTVTANTYVQATTYITAGTYVSSGTYVQVGSHVKFNSHPPIYLFTTTATLTSDVIAEATAISASLRGSMTFGPSVWRFDSDSTATKI